MEKDRPEDERDEELNLIYQEQKIAIDPYTNKPVELLPQQEFEIARLGSVWKEMTEDQQKEYVLGLLRNYYVQMEGYKLIVKKKWGIA